MDEWQPPISAEQRNSLGLNGWMIDMINGPEPVLSMLCDTTRLHRTGASLVDINDEQFERLKDSPIQSWVAGRQSYRINRRREYGPNALSTIVSPVNVPSIWTNAGPNTDEQRAIRERVKETESDLSSIEEQHQQIKDELNQLKEH